MSKTYGSGKKEMFMRPQRNKMTLVACAFLITALIAVFLYFSLFDNAAPEAGEVNYFGEPVREPRSYIGRAISMTEIEPVIEGDQIIIPLELVDSNSIINFEMENDAGLMVPMMAYITPSGRLFAGSSMCEPCGGRTFSLAGETMVCDTCRTTYTIEDHQFISGSPACGSYPPVNMNPIVENGMIKIPLAEVLKWRIRA